MTPLNSIVPVYLFNKNIRTNFAFLIIFLHSSHIMNKLLLLHNCFESILCVAVFFGLRYVRVYFPLYEKIEKHANDFKNGEQQTIFSIKAQHLFYNKIQNLLTIFQFRNIIKWWFHLYNYYRVQGSTTYYFFYY